MRSKISFCKKELIINNLKMYGLLSVLWGIFLFLAYPLRIITNRTYYEEYVAENIFDILYSWVFLIPIVFSVILAIILFHFLKTDNGVAFHMSLPAGKAEIFFSQFISGFLIYFVPLLVNTGLIALVSAMRVQADRELLPIGVEQWFLIMVLLFLVNFSISAGIGMVTGSVIWQIIFVIIFYFLPSYFEGAGIFFGQQLLKGFDHINPLHDFYETIDIGRFFLVRITSYDFYGNWEIILSALIYAVIVFGLAFLIYRLKKMESNREWVSFRFVKIFFIVGFTLCFVILMATFFGIIIYPNDKVAVYAGAGIGAILGYIISAMIAWKTIYLKKAWFGVLASLIIILGGLWAVDMDFFGYESYIPSTDEIKEIQFSGNGFFIGDLKVHRMIESENEKYGYYYDNFTFTDPEMIEVIREIHKEAIQPPKVSERYGYLRIQYAFKNGRKVLRKYENALINEELYNKLFLSNEALKKIYLPLDESKEDTITSIEVQTEIGRTVEPFAGKEMKELLEILRYEIIQESMHPQEVEIWSDGFEKIIAQEEVPILVSIETESGSSSIKQQYRREYPERAKATKRWNYIFYGKNEKLRKWLQANNNLRNWELENAQIEKLDFYKVKESDIRGYGISAWRGYYRTNDFDGQWLATVNEENLFAKYLQNSGRLIEEEPNKEIVLMAIRLKNGINCYRVINQKTYDKIAE